MIAIADLAEGDGAGRVPTELDLAWLCEEFHCLPSQIENEDAVLVQQMRQARRVWRFMARYTANLEGFIESASKADWELLQWIEGLRKGSK